MCSARQRVTSYVVTGQDAEIPSVAVHHRRQAVDDGAEGVRTLVADAIAPRLLPDGGTPEKTTTYNNGKIDVPAKPSVVVTVTRAMSRLL